MCRIAPGNLALVCGGLELDYQALDLQIVRVCKALVGFGVPSGARLAVWDALAETSLLLLHAAPRLNCSLAPMNPDLPDPVAGKLLQAIRPDFIIGNSIPSVEIARPFPHIPEPFLLLQKYLSPDTVDCSSHPYLDMEAIGLMLATSGTEGQPRVVALSRHNLMSSAAASRQLLGLLPGDCWLLCLPLFHIGGLSVPLRCAEAGAALVLHKGFDARAVCADLRRYRVTHLSLVPAMLVRLLAECPDVRPPESLRVVLVGGGPLDEQVAQQALDTGWPICPSYGMTETASQVATLCPATEKWKAGTAGKPLGHLEVRIGADSGRIEVRGSSVMLGYVERDGTLTSPLQDGWLVTADLGQWDDEGNLLVLGRADDVLISGGENVHPQWVEQRLGHCPGVKDVAVSCLPDSTWGDSLVALYCGAAGPTELENWSQKHLRGAMRPKVFRKVEYLPRNHLGKLDRAALRQILSTMGSNPVSS